MGNTTSDNFDDILTGTTLRVYHTLMTLGRPVGPRELQKKLRLSSPSVAAFHLEKLERSGLATKTAQGEYALNEIYLKHFVRLRRFLIPRYMFHGMLASFLLVGWIFIFLSPHVALVMHDQTDSASSILELVFTYGVAVTALLTILFWYETIAIMRKEKI